MTCHEARDLYSALVDDALTPGEREGLEAHVAGCAECRRELDRFRQTVALVQGLGPERAPAGFVDRVLEASTPWHRRLARRLFLPLRVKLPLEAAAMLMVGVLAVFVFQHTPEVQQAARQVEPPTAPTSAPPPAADAPAPAVAPVSRPSAPPAARLAPAAPSSTTGVPPERSIAAPGAPRAAPPPSPPGAISPVAESPAAKSPAAKSPAAKSMVAPASPSEATRKQAADAQQGGALANRAAETQVGTEKGARAQKEQDTERQAAAPRSDVGGAAPGALFAPAQGRAKAAPEPKPLIASPPADALEEGRARDARKEAAPQAKADGALRSNAPRPADVTGRLVVADREPALRGLGDLLSRVGGREVGRRAEGDSVLVEAQVPRERYVEFSQGLGRLGRWTPSEEAADLPALILVALRIGS